MGNIVKRHWDERTRTSRAAQPDDSAQTLFDAFVPHPITGWDPSLASDTWTRLAQAQERCTQTITGAEADGDEGGLPAEWLLSRAESIGSSAIEGIQPSARRVARAEAQLSLFEEAPPSDEMQALRNIGVTRHAVQAARDGTEMTLELLAELHETLMGDDPITGQFRDRQNWVGGGLMGGPQHARHVGPPAELVPELLADLVAYVNAPVSGPVSAPVSAPVSVAGQPPLLRAAIAHLQFETIHPFGDGNGRTGRALMQFMLQRDMGITNGTLPVSSALMLEKERYFDSLDSARVIGGPDSPQRSQSLGPIVDLVADAAVNACALSDRLNLHIKALRQKWRKLLGSHRYRRGGSTDRLLAALPTEPILTARTVEQRLGISNRAARNAIAPLAEAGILVQRSAGRSNRVYECGDIMDAFTESARAQPADTLAFDVPEDPDPPES